MSKKTELKLCLSALKNKQLILYPTDTVWGLGCDATDEQAVKKIYKLKNRIESKSLIVLVSSIKMLQKYVFVPKIALELLKKNKTPTTIIYNNPIGIAENVISKEDNTIAIRIVQDRFCKILIDQYNKPIVSTSANVSGKPTPITFTEISQPILEGVDYIVNSQQEKKTTKSSTILKIEGDKIVVLRE